MLQSASLTTVSISMTLPYFTIANQKVAVFKHFGAFFYSPFINTTPAGSYSVLQKIEIHGENFTFNWPSSEQAYHAQKLIHLKKKIAALDPLQGVLTQALHKIQNATPVGREYLPQQYTALVEELVRTQKPRLGNSKLEFDSFCDAHFHSIHAPHSGINPATGKPVTLDFMRTVIRLKLEQHPELKNTAMQLAREGIIPIEVSRHDANWASGADGRGLNMLGVLILEEGNRLLMQQGEPLTLTNPALSYEQLRAGFFSQLKHDVLEPKQQLMKSNIASANVQPSVGPSPQVHFHNPSKGHYLYNNANPQLATKAVYYDEHGTRVQGYYKPYRQINAAWITATSFNNFDMAQFPAQIIQQPIGNQVRVQSPYPIPIAVPSHVHTINHAAFGPKDQLINNLKLDANNPAHLSYWKNQVFTGGFNYKGHIIPHTLAKVFNYIEANKNTPLSYPAFKQGLEQILKEKSSSLSAQLGLSGFFRSQAVKELRHKAEAGCVENSCLP